MDRKLTDEEIDRLAKTLVASFAADDATVAEIADSPQLWWKVKRSIRGATPESVGLWSLLTRRWLVAGICAAVVLLAMTVWLTGINRMSVSNEQVTTATAPVTKPAVVSPPATVTEDRPSFETVGETAVARPGVRRLTAPVSARPIPAPRRNRGARPVPRDEIKTDFIPLTYAANTEGGQVVRVKVPGSMMTSLGVTNGNVRNTEMVAAEIIVGDDGQARAIRFIR